MNSIDNFRKSTYELNEYLSKEKLFGTVSSPTILSIYEESGLEPEIDLGRFKVNHGNDSANINQIAKERFTTSFYQQNQYFSEGKVLSALRIISIIDEVVGPNYEFTKSLDICCGAGEHALTYKYFGVSREALGIDIVNRSLDHPEDMDLFITNTHQSCQGLAAQNQYHSILKGTEHPHHLCQAPWTSRDPRNKSNRSIMLDDYIVDDFLNTNKVGGNYDLVTLYAGLEYFDQNKFFEQLKSIMQKGGLFFTVNDFYWEELGASMHLPAPPYLHAMMNEKQLKQFYLENFSSDAEKLIDSIFYFGENYVTAKSQEACASSHGFKLIYQRRIPSFLGMQFPLLAKNIYKALLDIPECPKPQYSDFNTYYLMQIYEYDPKP